MSDESVRCFMDGIDWQHELRGSADGATLYPSEAGLLRASRHLREGAGCGIVEVERGPPRPVGARTRLGWGAGMSRALTVTEKVPVEASQLAAAIYAHVDFLPSGRVKAVRFSSPGRFEGQAIDLLLDRLGHTLTSMLKEAQG